MRRSSRRLAGQLRLVALAALFVSTVIAHDAVIAEDTAITHDPQALDPIGWHGKLRFHAVSA